MNGNSLNEGELVDVSINYKEMLMHIYVFQ